MRQYMRGEPISNLLSHDESLSVNDETSKRSPKWVEKKISAKNLEKTKIFLPIFLDYYG